MGEAKRFTVGFALHGYITVEAADANEAVEKASNINLAEYIRDTEVTYVEEET
ncbi:MAG: hypothetical protein QW587_04875 [Candidatus Bathyarchaeia archaeon]